MKYHTPVLLHESVEGLNIKTDGIFVDATFGSGGHSREILRRIRSGRLFAFDQDPDAERNLIRDKRFVFIRHNFRYLDNFLRYHGVKQVDGILADLGVSSHQFDDPGRGFSYRISSMLDMRMNPFAPKTARDVLNRYSGEELVRIFREYGEVANAARLVSEIMEYRKQREIIDTGQFIEVIRSCIPRQQENKYLSKVFQALRIEVNDEMGSLKDLLLHSVQLLKPGGRLVVITYHSLEDRMVKHLIRSGNFAGTVEKDLYGHYRVPFRQIHRKVMVPRPDEIAKNPRARSAKLRIAERNKDNS